MRVLSYSVTNASLLFPNREEYIGLENFDYLLNQDAIFRTAVKNTLVFTFFSVMGGFGLGFALALLLNENIPLRNVLRGAALIPWVIPGVIVA